jgi:zinc/manganese transport system permease protein
VIGDPVIQHALVAGTAIAIACGLVGWFVVLRAQVFAADAMSHFAFTGAVAGVAVGIDPRVGLFGVTFVCALLLAALGGRSRVDDVTIGIAITWVLGLGVLGLSFVATGSSGGSGATAANALFGTILGLDAAQAQVAAVIAAVIVVIMLVIARPLLLASVDGVVARARGVPVLVLGVVFLVALGGVAAEATQAVGALLLLGLIAAPAGAAHRLTSRPYLGMSMAAGIGVGSVWLGLWIATIAPSIPPSSAITGVAAAAFFAAHLPARSLRRMRGSVAGRPAGPATVSEPGAERP